MDPNEGLNFIQKFFKYIFCAINGLFVALGIILIALGALVLTRSEEYRALIQDGFYSVPALLLTLGCFTTVLFFFGCWGLKKGSYCLVMVFAVLLSIILILEVVAGISAYMLRSESGEIFEQTLEKSLQQAYNTSNPNNTESREIWDKIQVELKCCGVNNYTDYEKYKLVTPPPQSCCVSGTECDTKIVTNLYQEGCGPKLESSIIGVISAASKWLIAIAILHLLWIVAACYYAIHFKRRQSYETV